MAAVAGRAQPGLHLPLLPLPLLVVHPFIECLLCARCWGRHENFRNDCSCLKELKAERKGNIHTALNKRTVETLSLHSCPPDPSGERDPSALTAPGPQPQLASPACSVGFLTARVFAGWSADTGVLCHSLEPWFQGALSQNRQSPAHHHLGRNQHSSGPSLSRENRIKCESASATQPQRNIGRRQREQHRLPQRILEGVQTPEAGAVSFRRLSAERGYNQMHTAAQLPQHVRGTQELRDPWLPIWPPSDKTESEV